MSKNSNKKLDLISSPNPNDKIFHISNLIFKIMKKELEKLYIDNKTKNGLGLLVINCNNLINDKLELNENIEQLDSMYINFYKLNKDIQMKIIRDVRNNPDEFKKKCYINLSFKNKSFYYDIIQE